MNRSCTKSIFRLLDRTRRGFDRVRAAKAAAGPCRQINTQAWYAVRYGGPKSQPPRMWGARPTLCRGGKIYNLMDAAMTAEQAKDFHKTAEAMFEYGMRSIAGELMYS